MSYPTPQLWLSKSDFNPPPIPASASYYWAAQDAAYASGAFLSHSAQINELSGALATSETGLSNAQVLQIGTSSFTSGVNVGDVSILTFMNPSDQFELRLYGNEVSRVDIVEQLSGAGVGFYTTNADAGRAHFEIYSADTSFIVSTKTVTGTILDATGDVFVSQSWKFLAGIDLTGTQISNLALATNPGNAVEFTQHTALSSAVSPAIDFVNTWPQTIGEWPFSGTVAVTGTYPSSGSLSANLVQLWYDFYNHIVPDVSSTMYASGSVTAFLSGTGSAYAQVPSEIYMKSQNYTWRVVIGDDGALSSSIVA